LTPAIEGQVAAWEKKLSANTLVWVPLDPSSHTSANGATLTKLQDLSVLSGGKRPDTDTYTIVAHTDVKGITGIRLEVLTDASLPRTGPGRQDNGNLHLNEFKVQAAPKNAVAHNRPVALQNPTADFNQDGWTIAMAIDANAKTAWGIYPQVSQPHRAVFEFKELVNFPGGTTLTVVLEQTHGGGHLLGRVRLSVTNSSRPLSATADSLPEAIRKIV